MQLKQAFRFKLLATMIITNKPPFIMYLHHMFLKLILLLKAHLHPILILLTNDTLNLLFMLPPDMFPQLIPIRKCHETPFQPSIIRTFELRAVNLCGMFGCLVAVQMVLTFEGLLAVFTLVWSDVFMQTLHVSHEFVVLWKRN